MCAFIFIKSPLKNLCTILLVLQRTFLITRPKKRITRETKSFSNAGERTNNFLGEYEPTVFSFFLPSWLSAYQNRPLGGNESIFFPSLTHQRIVTFRIEIRFDFNDTHVNTHLNTTRKMFSLTQSASFCATKVNVAAQKKQQSKISRSIQAGKAISSESLSKRDFLSAAVLSFGFLSVGDANAATKRVRKSSSSAAPVKRSPAAKKSAAKPAYKPKGKTVVPAPSVATSPAARRGRRGVPIAGKSSSVSGGKRKTRSPAQARKGKY